MLKSKIIRTIGLILAIYIGVCGLLFIMQEKLIFLPTNLDESYEFRFGQPFEELFIKVEDAVKLSGLLFKADSSQGLVFYLHGNAGSLASWGRIADTYTELGFDIFILDYRGYGKSEGSICSEQQFLSDIQKCYDHLLERYNEKDVTVIGYSIGTGPAAKIAANNNPERLILQAPYYSLTDMMDQRYPFVPDFLLKYKFDTYKYLQETRVPAYLFHGTSDRVIYYGSSEKLKEYFKPGDELHTLQGAGHNGMNDLEEYRRVLGRILK